MFQRKIDKKDVINAIENGQVLLEYFSDIPYPSKLILGWSDQRPIHVVIAENKKDKEIM